MRVTIKDIAKAANVSATTVSRVINNYTAGISETKRVEIKKLIETMGYRPNIAARNLVTKKSSTIGLILPSIVNPFFPEIARGVQDLAQKYGYSTIIINTDGDSEKEIKAIELLQDNGVEGILYCNSNLNIESNRIRSLIKKVNDTPLVVIGSNCEEFGISSVYPNAKTIMAYMFKELYNRGHRKFIYVAGLNTDAEYNEGYAGFLKEIKSDCYHSICKGNFNVEEAEQVIGEYIESEISFSAVICESDMMAVGVLNKLKNSGYLVPEEIVVLGYDNTIFSQFTTPKLSTLNIPKYELGAKGVEILLRTINNKIEQLESIELECNYIKRESS